MKPVNVLQVQPFIRYPYQYTSTPVSDNPEDGANTRFVIVLGDGTLADLDANTFSLSAGVYRVQADPSVRIFQANRKTPVDGTASFGSEDEGADQDAVEIFRTGNVETLSVPENAVLMFVGGTAQIEYN